jgi:cell division protein FtsL
MIRRWLPLWALPMLLAMAIGTVWLRLSIVRTTYEINQADKMIRNQRQELEQAELRLAGLRSPRRLEALARARFGLAPPKSDQVVFLK